MGVTVSIAYNESQSGAVLPTTISGGIRIEVAETELTRIVTQNHLNAQAEIDYPEETWWFNYQGEALDAGRYEYKGESVATLLNILSENVLKLAKGGVERFEEAVTNVGRAAYVLVFCYIDDTHGIVGLHSRIKGNELVMNTMRL